MTASTFTSAPQGLRPHLLLVLVALLTAAPWAARADEIPLLRQGLWEFQRTAGVSRFAATECIDPSEDLRRQHAALEKMGCKLSPALRAGSTYTYTADCSVKLPSGAVTFSTTSVLTAESDTAYRIENRQTSQGATSNESITAQRVADCAR
ncbi:MAG TPA: DUF3617 family protein [Casimicrobiaceae bacterium]|jgi:hypothetical protein|nr:DUF3617 family protein [Casimicrobiaceae bacterium]